MIKKIKENCTCVNCSRSNYNSRYAAKAVNDIYQIEIGNTVIRVCEDCLTQLYAEARVILSK